MANLGQLVIAELGRRGRRGMYFAYQEYVALRSAADPAELHAFLDVAGYVGIPLNATPSEVVDILQGVAEEQERSTLIRVSAWAPLLLVLSGVPVLGDLVGTALWRHDCDPRESRVRATSAYLEKARRRGGRESRASGAM